MSLLFPISPPQQAVYQVKCIAFINNSGLKLKFAVSISAGTRLTCWVAPGQKCRPPIKPLGSLHSMYSLSLTKYNLLTILWPRGKFLTVPVGSSNLGYSVSLDLLQMCVMAGLSLRCLLPLLVFHCGFTCTT